jgi:hypothetical protein
MKFVVAAFNPGGDPGDYIGGFVSGDLRKALDEAVRRYGPIRSDHLDHVRGALEHGMPYDENGHKAFDYRTRDWKIVEVVQLEELE